MMQRDGARTRVCGVDVPTEYVCPITHEIMATPVLAMDGFVYEASAIERWLSQSRRSPLTNQELPSATLVPCHPIKALITSFLDHHPEVGAHVRNSMKRPSCEPSVPQDQVCAQRRPSLLRSISLGRRRQNDAQSSDADAAAAEEESPAAAGRRAILTRGGSMTTSSGNLRNLLASATVGEADTLSRVPVEDLLEQDDQVEEGLRQRSLGNLQAAAGGAGQEAETRTSAAGTSCPHATEGLEVKLEAEYGEVAMGDEEELHALLSLKASGGAAAGASSGGAREALGVDLVAVVDCSVRKGPNKSCSPLAGFRCSMV